MIDEVSALKREDAFFYKYLLMLGYEENYDAWLSSRLESENPLSDTVLELSCCSSDMRKTISLLHNCCADQPVDEFAVCDRLRQFFKEAFYSNKMNKDEIISDMFRLTRIVCDCGDFDLYNIRSWQSMDNLHDLCCFAEEGLISRESFDDAFFSYLDHGTPVEFGVLWQKNHQKKQSLFDRVKSYFKRGTD